MSQHFESFILTLVLIADVRTVDMCNSVNHTSTRGYIWLNISHRPEPIRCEHNILAPGNVTTTLRIDRFRGNVGEVKLVIYGSSFPRKDVYPLKKRKIPIYYKTIGNFVTLRILANSWSRAELIMGYFAESNESCAHPKLQCLDGKGCFKTVQICDGIFSCMDHSDETSCGECPPGKTLCNNRTSTCFDPSLQRCDGIIDCPAAEDELACMDTCRNKIACRDPQMCFPVERRCDGRDDCPDGYDEHNCTEVVTIRRTCLKDERRCKNGICIPQNKDGCNDDKDESFTITIPISASFGVILSFGFIYLVYRWLSLRRNAVNVSPEMVHPVTSLDVKDIDYSGYDLEFSDADFMHGGEIYEAFVSSRNRRTQRRRRNKRERLVIKSNNDGDSAKETNDQQDSSEEMKRNEQKTREFANTFVLSR